MNWKQKSVIALVALAFLCVAAVEIATRWIEAEKSALTTCAAHGGTYIAGACIAPAASIAR